MFGGELGMPPDGLGAGLARPIGGASEGLQGPPQGVLGVWWGKTYRRGSPALWAVSPGCGGAEAVGARGETVKGTQWMWRLLATAGQPVGESLTACWAGGHGLNSWLGKTYRRGHCGLARPAASGFGAWWGKTYRRRSFSIWLNSPPEVWTLGLARPIGGPLVHSLARRIGKTACRA